MEQGFLSLRRLLDRLNSPGKVWTTPPHTLQLVCSGNLCPMMMGVMCPAANVSILGVTYSLFTHAHQRYGLNDAFDRSVSILLDGPALKDDKNAVWVRTHTHTHAFTCPTLVQVEGRIRQGVYE